MIDVRITPEGVQTVIYYAAEYGKWVLLILGSYIWVRTFLRLYKRKWWQFLNILDVDEWIPTTFVAAIILTIPAIAMIWNKEDIQQNERVFSIWTAKNIRFDGGGKIPEETLAKWNSLTQQ